MSRWAPDARARLETAALELFSSHGYEETTVTQIAERAGLNRATFFRHFPDKREVLFGAEETVAVLFADGIRSASPDAALAECLDSAFRRADSVMTAEQRAKAAIRVRVLATNAEVQERGLLKHARIAEAISAALRDRGFDDLTARLGAELGMLAFSVGLQRWMESAGETYSVCAASALRDLQARAVSIGA